MQNKGSSYAAWFFLKTNFAEAVRGGHEEQIIITDEEWWEKQAEVSEDIDVECSDTSTGI